MKQTRKHAQELHEEIKEWISQVDFIKEELAIYQKQLEEVAAKYTSQDVLAEVEHFQNQFIRQREVSDEIRHDYKQEENKLVKLAQENPASEHVLLDDHSDLRENTDTYVHIYSEVKDEFHKFLAKYM